MGVLWGGARWAVARGIKVDSWIRVQGTSPRHPGRVGRGKRDGERGDHVFHHLFPAPCFRVGKKNIEIRDHEFLENGAGHAGIDR